MSYETNLNSCNSSDISLTQVGAYSLKDLHAREHARIGAAQTRSGRSDIF